MLSRLVHKSGIVVILFIFRNPDSRLPTPDSRLPTPDSLFPIPCSLFPVPLTKQSHPIKNCYNNYSKYGKTT
ncbi:MULTISPECIES: hypothetical protein [unclassified Moorena]|uniref:hypothetical protein n=1 Tax=unclassified Moorena TaxID=2683338 RepID=UPI0013FFD6B8|nr:MULTISPECIES: hypothetical protein [unclassified Moorena]NEO16299.1 hypothetical protein [Moorena sp. SIO3E8]NEQ02837.1 hypothetical protein [Moorena sp. SIO3F7]